MPIKCNLDSINSALLAPYKEAAKHLSFASEGRVQHAAERVFSKIKDSDVLFLKERVFHILATLALSIPLLNLISQHFIPKIDRVDLNARANQVIGDQLGNISPLSHSPYEVIQT
jgi:hypothetical protein